MHIKIKAMNKSNEIGLDYFSPTIFVEGCNFACPYCMNAKLVRKEVDKEISLQEVLQFTSDNKCDYIVVSGGELLIYDVAYIFDFLDILSSQGSKIALCTNGYHWEKLEKIIKKLTYVALDIKTDEGRYKSLINDPEAYRKVFASAEILLDAKARINNNSLFNYELRTTLYPPLVDKVAISRLSKSILPDEKWVWQRFRISKNMLDNIQASAVSVYNDIFINELINIAAMQGHNINIESIREI